MVDEDPTDDAVAPTDPLASDPLASEQPASDKPSRRGFLAATIAAAVAGAAAGAGGVAAAQSLTGGSDPMPVPTGSPSPSASPRLEGAGFDHLVVVMFENRSFDNLLGYLYEGPDGAKVPDGQRFEGLQAGYSNVAPDGAVVPAHAYEGATDVIMRSPDPDPGEEYPAINIQFFGDLGDSSAPIYAPPAGATPTMDGFVADYVHKFQEDNGRAPTTDEYTQIMGSFTPQMLPVLSTLARSFTLYDHWHCAVPSQTFCNRSFFHASSSHGFVTNSGDGIGKWMDAARNRATTIFNRLQDAGISWGIYYDDRQLISLTGFLHAPQLEPYWKTNFHTMSTFRQQVADGTLPAYAFIEPRLLYDHNDMHPPGGPITKEDIDGMIVEGAGISDVRAGDALIHDVYTSIRTSPATTGSTPLNTALLITFDEHGGTYDHVPPPAAVPPFDYDPKETEMGFAFDRLGGRVPALLISAYSPAAVNNDPMHHAAVIASLNERYGLEPLTRRDAGAPTLASGLSLSQPRDPATWPTTFPAYVPKNPESVDPKKDPIADGQHHHALSPPGLGLVSMLMARYGAPGEKVPKTYLEAWTAVQKYGMGLFGT